MWKRSSPLVLAAALTASAAANLGAAPPSRGQELGTLVQQGVTALQEGRLDDAAAAFRAALRVQPDSPIATTLLANVMVQQGNPRAALDMLTEVVEAEPDYYPARNVIARAYVALEQPQAAIPHLQAAVRLKPDDASSRALLAELLMQADRLDEAAEQARELVRLHPDAAAAHNLLGTIELRRADFDGALAEYDKVLETAADDAFARYGKAAALAGLERDDEAVPLLARLVDEDPKHADALTLLAELLSKRGVEEQLDAIRLFRSAHELAPDSRRIVRGLTKLYLDLDLNDQGIELIRESGDPKDPQLLMALGRMLEREDQYEEARTVYRQALDAGSGADAHYRLGVVLVNLSDLAGAADEFRTTLELDRRHPSAARELGSVLLDEGDAEAAREALDRAVARSPEDAQAWYLAGVAYLRTGDPATAVDYLHTALDLDPENAEALYNLGTALGRQGRAEESRQTLARAQELRQARQGADAAEARSRRSDAIARAGYVRYRIGDYESARAMFEQVLELAPDDERSLYYLGLTRAALGDDEAAITTLERVTELNPDRAGAWAALARLYDRAGRAEDARLALQRAQEIARRQSPGDR